VGYGAEEEEWGKEGSVMALKGVRNWLGRSVQQFNIGK
jgi:hypothetical protein